MNQDRLASDLLILGNLRLMNIDNESLQKRKHHFDGIHFTLYTNTRALLGDNIVVTLFRRPFSTCCSTFFSAHSDAMVTSLISWVECIR